MLVLDVLVTRSAFVLRRFQEAQQCVAAVSAGRFVLHVEKVAGGLKGAEGAVLHVAGEQLGIGGGCVLVPFAVHEQHRHVDFLCRVQVALAVAVEHVVDVKMHLPVFMFGQRTDVTVVEALEQRGQVFADGAVYQVTDPVPVTAAEIIDTALKVVEHVLVDHRRERADHSLFDAPWLLGEGDERGGATKGKRQHMLGGEVVDQLKEDLPFDFLGEHFLMQVVGLGLARVGLVVAHHIELWVKVFHGLCKRRSRGHRAVDQNNGLLCGVCAIELRVNPILTLYIQHSDFWPHVIRLLASGYARKSDCTSFVTGRHTPGIFEGPCRSIARWSTGIVISGQFAGGRRNLRVLCRQKVS